MRRGGVVCAVGVVLLASACGGGGASAKQEAARFAVAYIDHARNGCCIKGLHAFAPKVAISKIDSRWATVSLHARDATGLDVGAEEFVLYRKPGGWTVFNGPSTDLLGCRVPRTIEAELRLTAGNCKPPTVLPGYIDCSYGAPTLKPSQLMIACGDGGFFITGLRWSNWSQRAAAGAGTGHLNDCEPTCAAGHFHAYPVEIALATPRTCGKTSGLQFTHLAVRLDGRKPRTTPRRFAYRSPCPRP